MAIIRNCVKKAASLFEKKIPVHIAVYEGNLLENHNAFIIGGSGGIGYEIANCFVRNGCKVVLSGTNRDKLKKVCSILGENSKYLITDITNVQQMRVDVISFLENEEDEVDILVNAAGIHGPSDFWNITENDWDSVMDTNVKGMFFLSQLFAKYMRDHNIHGHILNISSASALKHGKTPYEISKNAVRAMSLGLAEECIKYGIVVNCLGPGPTATNMLHMNENSSLNWPANPTGRVATPKEIANWALFLVSKFGDYIVGDTVYVSGGSGTVCIDK